MRAYHTATYPRWLTFGRWLRRLVSSFQLFLQFRLGIPTSLVRPLYSIERARRVKKFTVGTYIEDCYFHPCEVVRNDGDGYLTVTDVLTGVSRQCDVFTCGMRRLSESQVTYFKELYVFGGDRALVLGRPGLDIPHIS